MPLRECDKCGKFYEFDECCKCSSASVCSVAVPDMPSIPESAANGIEFCLWSLEKAGIEFVNGKTAAYWHLISTVSQHIKGKQDV